MPIASQRYPAGETVGLPPWLAAVWDFARRDPVVGMTPVGMVPSTALRMGLPHVARLGGVGGGHMGGPMSRLIARALDRPIVPPRMLDRPLKQLPSPLTRASSKPWGDRFGDEARAVMLFAEQPKKYLGILRSRLAGPTQEEGLAWLQTIAELISGSVP